MRLCGQSEHPDLARQTVGTNVSDDSTPVIVAPPGNGPLRIAMAVRETDAYDHDLGCAADGTGFNPNQPSVIEFIGASGYDAFGVPNCPRYVPQLEWFELRFNPCDPVYGVYAFSGNGVLNLNPPPNHTNGVWEGLYFRIDAFSPTKGPFTVYLDDMAVKDAAGATALHWRSPRLAFFAAKAKAARPRVSRAAPRQSET